MCLGIMKYLSLCWNERQRRRDCQEIAVTRMMPLSVNPSTFSTCFHVEKWLDPNGTCALGCEAVLQRQGHSYHKTYKIEWFFTHLEPLVLLGWLLCHKNMSKQLPVCLFSCFPFFGCCWWKSIKQSAQEASWPNPLSWCPLIIPGCLFISGGGDGCMNKQEWLASSMQVQPRRQLSQPRYRGVNGQVIHIVLNACWFV
jgi:hypothetical protein